MRRTTALALLFAAILLPSLADPGGAQACSNTTVESGGAYRAQRADNYENIDDLCDAVLAGVGAKNGAAVAVVEYGDNAVHKSVFTLTALSVTMTDAGAAGSHGGLKIYDFPAGAIGRLGCTFNLTTLAGAGGIADGAAVVGALGSVVTATDNAALTTTEADFIASTAGTLTAGAGALAGSGVGNFTLLDGHTTAIDLFLNLAVPDADSSANDTVAVSGTVTCVWTMVGDW